MTKKLTAEAAITFTTTKPLSPECESALQKAASVYFGLNDDQYLFASNIVAPAIEDAIALMVGAVRTILFLHSDDEGWGMRVIEAQARVLA